MGSSILTAAGRVWWALVSFAEGGGAVLIRDPEACGGAGDGALLGQSAGQGRGGRVCVITCLPSVTSKARVQQ